MFDAECDFAAIAYGMGDDPDGLLLRFAEDLRGSGHRVAGVVQHRVRGPGHSNLGAVMLPGVQVVKLGYHSGNGTNGCHIDSKRLATIASAIDAAIEEGSDLVIINRFGKLEAAGRGLIRLIERAAEADIPVITAVPVYLFAAWIKYSSGMTVRLPCRRAAIDTWWQSVAGAANGGGGVSFCAVAK